jgi:hypothetical protein
MIGYASRTGTRANLARLRDAGWRLIISPTETRKPNGFRYGLENGAWTAHCQNKPFDEARFLDAVERLGRCADWIVIPDIVAGGMASLDFSLRWHNRLTGIAPLLLAVQDGMTPDDVGQLLGPDLGIFVGGSTEFKLASLTAWGELAAARGCWLHVGRVNTMRRLYLCAAAGADSFDGTSVSRYGTTLELLDSARRQTDMFAS